jgi:RNA polymerase sigma-70 factor, ECF subfamily
MGTGAARRQPGDMPVLLHHTALPTRSDEELVGLLRAGHPGAFEAIVERYRPRLTPYARQLLGGAHHDAEEVVQDAFVRALHALRANDNEMALKAWLHTIVRNRALDVLRRPVRTTDIEPHEPLLASMSADPHAALARREELRALIGGLRELPERQRTALVLHELGGASHESIGRRLGVSAGGSKALVHRGRAGVAHLRVAA